MIHIISKELCCGCNACVQKCPQQCIMMHEDEEGFLYPKIDLSLCIDCHLCENVCPVQNQNSERFPDKCLAIKNNNDDIRRNSSSGGFFSLIAEHILSKGGIVFGACFNEKWEVVHSYTEDIDNYTKFRGSKYVQSKIGNSYIQVKEFLNKGREVLFSGTPCQIAALRLFLGKEYTNLLCLDFVCHGVPSPGIFRWYLQEEVNKYLRQVRKPPHFTPVLSIPKSNVFLPKGIQIKNIFFRDKKLGWKKYSFNLQLSETLAEKKVSSVSLTSSCSDNSFLRGFSQNYYLRPSCHKCPCKHLKSGSDITMADFWGQENSFPDFDNDTGVSAVFANTIKGAQLINQIKNHAQSEYRPLNDFIEYNPCILFSVNRTEKRDKFWSYPNKYSFEERINKTSKASLKERILYRINKIKL